ncbi:hypothetical protein CC80DRAFT_556117 [Byssothecium circinans]|uniref:Uncharacterized protein n=1 Tax=Byssothecium circinans TaxID=147558 RepID=A0A6A5T7X0_9PLEO|nr:hypothetical protein CC80DRAFT_556117 [Byssothecium circinans]
MSPADVLCANSRYKYQTKVLHSWNLHIGITAAHQKYLPLRQTIQTLQLPFQLYHSHICASVVYNIHSTFRPAVTSSKPLPSSHPPALPFTRLRLSSLQHLLDISPRNYLFHVHTPTPQWPTTATRHFVPQLHLPIPPQHYHNTSFSRHYINSVTTPAVLATSPVQSTKKRLNQDPSFDRRRRAMNQFEVLKGRDAYGEWALYLKRRKTSNDPQRYNCLFLCERRGLNGRVSQIHRRFDATYVPRDPIHLGSMRYEQFEELLGTCNLTYRHAGRNWTNRVVTVLKNSAAYPNVN